MSGKSIFDKLWERHVITGEEGEPQLMYVDQHYIHEVTSPQAFQGLRDADRKVRRPELTFGTTDHNVPTVDIFNIRDLISISKANETDVAQDTPDYSSMNKTERKEAIKKLQKQMHEAAEMLDFELAAQLRDMVLELKAMD